MPLTGADERGWLELHAYQDDETLGRFVRLLRTAYERRDRSAVRAQAVRLLLDLPGILRRRMSCSVDCATSVSRRLVQF